MKRLAETSYFVVTDKTGDSSLFPLPYSLFLLLFLVGGLVMANGVLHAEKLPIRSYTSADGLASPVILFVTVDSRGFVWACTRDGLSRFDGTRFVSYGQEQGLTDPSVRWMTEIDGEHVVLLNDGSLVRLNNRSMRKRGGKSGMPDTLTLFSGGHADGNSVLGRLKELYGRRGQCHEGFLTGNILQSDDVEGFPGKVNMRAMYPWPVAADKRGCVWSVSVDGLHRCSPEGVSTQYSISPRFQRDMVQALMVDRSNMLWVGHAWEGLIVLHPDSVNPKEGESLLGSPSVRVYSSRNGLKNDNIQDLVEAPDGKIWISTGGGLIMFDGASFHSFTTENGLSTNSLKGLAFDNSGNLWIGSSNGLMKLAPNGFVTYDKTDGIAGASVRSIGQDRSGRFMAVTDDWQINLFYEGKFTSTTPRLPPGVSQGYMSQGLHLDKTGEWWILTDKGVFRSNLTGPPKLAYGANSGLASSDFRRVYEDALGNLWFGTGIRKIGQSGLLRWDRASNTFHSFTEADGVPLSHTAWSFCEDQKGTLWIGFYQGGLGRYTRDGRFTFFTGNGLPEKVITAVLVDQKNRLWLGSNQNGVALVDRIDGDTLRFQYYTALDGLSGNNVRSLIEDHRGRIYIGTARGLSRLDPETGRIRRYTSADGLGSDAIGASYRTGDNALWFSTSGGLSRLPPVPDEADSQPEVFIGSIGVGGIQLPVAELGEKHVGDLEFEPDQNTLQVDFFSIAHQIGEVVRYQYRLEGGGNNWSSPSPERSVIYASLAPGTYRFAVRAITSTGVVSDSSAIVSFVIFPPFWMTWWFSTLVLLVVSSVGYSVYRYRLNKMLEVERLRVRLAGDLHDELASNLSSIAMSSVVSLADSPERMKETLMKVKVLAEESAGSIRDIIWALDPTTETVDDLFSRARYKLTSLCETQRIDLDFEIPGQEQFPEGNLEAETRRDLWLLLKEACMNAIKHSGCTRLSVGAQYDNGLLRVEVTDDGRGFDAERTYSGKGLGTMKSRATKLKGSIVIESPERGGTKVTFTARL